VVAVSLKNQFFSYANHVFDARQARRLFTFIIIGGLLGAILGGQIASLLWRRIGTHYLLLVAAGVVLPVIVIMLLIEARRPRQEWLRQQRQETVERLRAARSVVRTLKGSRLVLLIALLVCFAVVVHQMVDLQFSWVLETATQELDEETRLGQRTSKFGNLYSLMGVFGILFQIIFTQRIHRALGVGIGMRILPLAVAAACIPLILSFGAGVAVPLWAVYVLSLSDNGLRNSVEQSTRQLLFMPVPSPIRLQANAFIDGFVQRFAKGVAAVMLLPVTLKLVTAMHLSWLIVAVVVVWLWVTTITRREYVRAFREGLKPGVGEDAPSIDTGDVTTMTMLVESLGSSDPRQVQHSLELMSAHGLERLVPPLLLHHEDAAVRRKTLDVLAAARRTDAVQLIERSIGDDDPQVRTNAIQALATLRGEDASQLMADRLGDPDPRLRSAAVASLLCGSDADLRDRATEVLDTMLDDDDPWVRVEAAKALAEVAEPAGSRSLVQLLYDRDLDVVREAMAAVRCRMERDGPNPLYIPILISLMGNRRLKHAARDAVVAYGEQAIQALVLFMNAEEEQIWVRRAVPKTIALIGSAAAASGLMNSLDVTDGFLRRKIIEALAYLRARHPEVKFKSSEIADQIRLEAGWYLRSFADLWTVSSVHEARFEGPYAQWQASARVPTLLQQVLAHRMAVAVGSIFGLLELIYVPRDVEAAYRSLMSGNTALRANALEYLDNTLTGAVRRDVFSVIDDAPPADKLHRAGQQFGVTADTPEETLGRLLHLDPENEPGSVHLTLAAIHSVYEDKVERYLPDVAAIAEESNEPILRETAEWVLHRLGHRPSVGPESDTETQQTYDDQGESVVDKMAQIEKVVFLQGVGLFESCNAEQLLQLAAIANDRQLEPGERLYGNDEPPDAMYCVVEGKVGLAGTEDAKVVVERGDTFGVVDILSGQLRCRSAAAEVSTSVLVIDAEDFFDLLSHNIEIVRALFQQLTRSSGDVAGALL
jgi:AAA family ATP:ADP antiporter